MSGDIKRKSISILPMFFGVVGGIISSILLISIYHFMEKSDNVEHILNWPFLLFLIIIFIIILFYEQLKLIASKGEIKIKWGDREISIQEIPAKIKEEVDKIEPGMSSKIDAKISQLEDKDFHKLPDEEKLTNNLIPQIKEKFNIQSDELANLVYYLGETQFEWRTQSTLAQKTGLSLSMIEKYAKEYPEIIEKNTYADDGKIIYKLTDSGKLKFFEVHKHSLR